MWVRAARQRRYTDRSAISQGTHLPQVPAPLTTVEQCGDGQYGNGECSDLLNYLDNLNDEDYEEAISCIADYVKHKAIFDIMESWSGGLFCQGSYLVASSNLHEALCSRICRVGYERPTSGKITGGWWIYFVNCGSGCCQTETEYCWENGISIDRLE